MKCGVKSAPYRPRSAATTNHSRPSNDFPKYNWLIMYEIKTEDEMHVPYTAYLLGSTSAPKELKELGCMAIKISFELVISL